MSTTTRRPQKTAGKNFGQAVDPGKVQGVRVAQGNPLGLRQKISVFGLLMTSEEFRKMYQEVKSLGMKVLELQTVPGSRMQGSYCPWHNVLEVPKGVFTPSDRIPDFRQVEIVAHEVMHAYQFRSILGASSKQVGGEKGRTKLVDDAMDQMGREKYISNHLTMEWQAESFAVRIAMKLLRRQHKGFLVWNKLHGGKLTPKEYHYQELTDFQHKTEERYRSGAATLWRDHLIRTGKEAGQVPSHHDGDHEGHGCEL